MDWAQTAVDSEIELSTAYGGRPQTYTNFTHVHNAYVPWSGDTNRSVGVRLTDFRSFDRTVAEVEQIHRVAEIEGRGLVAVPAPRLVSKAVELPG